MIMQRNNCAEHCDTKYKYFEIKCKIYDIYNFE